MTASRPRLGVFGGSFDPPHLAHLAIASEAAHALGLERVVFVPAATPPHKEPAGRTPGAVRLSLTELAVSGDPRFTASGIEIDRGLVYTRDTVKALGTQYPGRALVFILGSDSLLQLETWHEPEALLETCTLSVALRPGDAPEAVAVAAARWGDDRVTVLDAPRSSISSSEVRARVADGRPIRYLVPRRIEQRISRLGLYR